MYFNNNLSDRLTAACVGSTWPPEYYDWVPEVSARDAIQKIARETEEDLDNLANLLKSLGIEVLRPDVLWATPVPDQPVPLPPICPGDFMAMIDQTLVESISHQDPYNRSYSGVFLHIQQQGNTIKTTKNPALCQAMHYCIDDRLYFSVGDDQNLHEVSNEWQQFAQTKTLHGFHLPGHIDGWFTPVGNSLLISYPDDPRQRLLDMFYKTYFPGRQVIYDVNPLINENSFMIWQQTNGGRWWVPGEENNIEFCNFVQDYLENFMGNVQETAFDVNILVIDKSTVVIKETKNTLLLSALEQHGITVYQVPFRHASIWDSSINCVTLALSRG